MLLQEFHLAYMREKAFDDDTRPRFITFFIHSGEMANLFIHLLIRHFLLHTIEPREAARRVTTSTSSAAAAIWAVGTVARLVRCGHGDW